MLNQHAKWLEATVREIPWRKPIASMNLLVSSHVWRQDHNGFSHQDPGVTSVLLNKCFHNDHVIGIYFATDANMLLAIAEKCYKSTNKINAIIAGKQPRHLADPGRGSCRARQGCRRLGLGFHREDQR